MIIASSIEYFIGVGNKEIKPNDTRNIVSNY
jgi:hypothetical protein